MSYAEFRPSEALAPYVAAYWRFRVAPEVGDVLHCVPLTGGFMLSLSVGDGLSLVFGPRTGPLRPVVRGGDAFWGVHFWPGAGGALLRLAAGDMRERVAPAADVFGGSWLALVFDALRSARTDRAATGAIDAALAQRVPMASPLDEQVMAVVLRIIGTAGSESVAEAARVSGLSERHLRRRFRLAVGLSPKQLSRLRRLRASAVEAVRQKQVLWSRVAIERGYADQPHLVGDFRSLTGLTPTSFLDHARRILHGRICS